MRFSAALSTLYAVTALAQTTTPNAPTLTYLYTLNATLANAIPVGAGPRGNRVAIPITGGSFSGPKLNGTMSLVLIILNFAIASSKANLKP